MFGTDNLNDDLFKISFAGQDIRLTPVGTVTLTRFVVQLTIGIPRIGNYN